MKNDVEEIRRIGERLLEAENTGTADDFGKFLAEDVVILAPYLPALEGKPACLEFVRTVLSEVRAEFDKHMTVQSAEIRVFADVAFDRGTWAQVLRPLSGGSPIEECGKYLHIYTRSDGMWKVFRIIFHYDDRAGEGDEA
jgi:ketosteroid isomerase-like protein